MPDRTFIDKLAEVWNSIGDVARGLSDADWDTLTECPGWTVRDNVSHITGTELMLLGRPSPAAAHEGRPHVKNVIGEMNEAWVDERRSWPGARVLEEFLAVTQERLAALRAMTDDQLEAETPSPIGRVPYATFMDVRVMDCWVHEQDIRRAIGRPGHLGGPAAEAAIDRFTGGFGFVVGKRVGAPDGSTVVLEITGPVARHLAVAVSGGRASAVDPPPQATAAVRTDTEAYACLVAGRWRAADAIDQGRVALSGDADMGRRVVESLPVIP